MVAIWDRNIHIPHLLPLHLTLREYSIKIQHQFLLPLKAMFNFFPWQGELQLLLFQPIRVLLHHSLELHQLDLFLLHLQ